jgi:hypothetical protein
LDSGKTSFIQKKTRRVDYKLFALFAVKYTNWLKKMAVLPIRVNEVDMYSFLFRRSDSVDGPERAVGPHQSHTRTPLPS